MSDTSNRKGILRDLEEESFLRILQFIPNVELTERKSVIILLFSLKRDYSRCIDQLNEIFSISSHIIENSFFFACINGLENCVSLFVSKRYVDPGIRNDEALGICCTSGHTNCVRILLQDYRVDPSKNQNKVLKIVTQEGHEDIFRLLLRHPKVDPRDRNHDFLRKACFLGRKEIVRMLLDDERVDPAVNLNEPVKLACYEGHVEILEMLLNDERVNPADQDNSALRLASSQGKTEIVRILLGDDRVNPTSKNNGALRHSIKSGNFELCRMLCDHPLVLSSPNLQEMSQLAEELGFPEISEMIRQRPSLEKKFKRAKDQLEKYIGRFRRTHSWKKMKELLSTLKRESILYKSTVLTFENQEKQFVTQKMIDLGNQMESELISFYERHLELSKDKNETRIYIGEMRAFQLPDEEFEDEKKYDDHHLIEDNTGINSSSGSGSINSNNSNNNNIGKNNTSPIKTSSSLLITALTNTNTTTNSNEPVGMDEMDEGDRLSFLSYSEQATNLPIEVRRRPTTINFHRLRTESQNFIPHGKGKIYIERSRAMGVYLQRMKVIFEGEFVDGVRCGKGKVYFSSSGKLEFQGVFRGNRRHGPGILFEKDGETIKVKGEWRNGKLYRIDIEDVFLERIDYSKIKKMLRRENRIGQGAYGEVYKVIYNRRKYAAKVLNTQDMEYSVMSIVRKNTEKMLKLCTSLSHPHTIKVYGMFDGDEGEIGYLMELCECSYQEVIGRENLTMSEKMRLLYQTAITMQYLHENSVMHRDLKWGNVLKDSMNDIKITDFEFAKVDETGWRSSAMNSTILGTPVYLAPEILQKDYTKKCDVYSFGMMIYCLYFDTLRPYSGKIDQMNCAICGKVITKPTFLVHVSECNLRPKIHWDRVPKEWKWLMDLMVMMWDGEKEKRPSFYQIVEVIRGNMEHTEGFTMVSILEMSDEYVRKFIMKNLIDSDRRAFHIDSVMPVSPSTNDENTENNNEKNDDDNNMGDQNKNNSDKGNENIKSIVSSYAEEEEEEEEEEEGEEEELEEQSEDDDDDDEEEEEEEEDDDDDDDDDDEYFYNNPKPAEKFLLMESSIQSIIDVIMRKWKLQDPKMIKRIYVVLRYEKYKKIINDNNIVDHPQLELSVSSSTTLLATPTTTSATTSPHEDNITFKNLNQKEEIQEREFKRNNIMRRNRNRNKKKKRLRKLVMLENNEQVKKFVDSESIIIVEFYKEMSTPTTTTSSSSPDSKNAKNNNNNRNIETEKELTLSRKENEDLNNEMKTLRLNNSLLEDQLSDAEKTIDEYRIISEKTNEENERLKKKLQFMKKYLEKKLKILDQLDEIINDIHKGK